MTPIGRNALVEILPERPKSSILYTEGIGTEAITRRAVVKAVGGLCQHVAVGDTVLIRTTLGVQVGNLTLVPENACVARVLDDA